MANDWTMHRGDTFIYDIEVKNRFGAAQDITGWTLWFTLKKTVFDEDNVAVALCSTGNAGVVVTDARGGKATATVEPLATRYFPGGDVVLVFDVQAKDTTGKVFTTETGTLTVSPDVTKTTV